MLRKPILNILIALLVASTTFAQEHLPLSGKSYTIGNGSATDWTHKYETLSFAGIPDKLSFNYAYIYTAQSNIGNPTLNYSSLSSFAQLILGIGGYSDERKGVGNTHMLYIEESADGTNWTTIWTNDDATNKDTHSSGDIQLKKSTRHIRFHHSCNFSNSYKNIRITELKYLEDPDPASVDFGTAVINSGEVQKTILLNWCNISPLTVSSSNPRFTVTPAGFGAIDAYGSQVLTVSYTHGDEAGTQEGTITISNGTNTKTIPVTATTSKRSQTITWNSDLAATGFAMNIGEQYPDEGIIPVLAIATDGGRITFTSDNSDIIEVIADTALLAKGIGNVNITAYQAGDAEYQEVTDTKQFVVTPLQKQAIMWDQNLYGLLTTGEPIVLTATATSGGDITYTSADESIVTINGNVLTIVGEGETYITATQAGFIDANSIEWLTVSQNNYVVVRNPASQCNGMALSQSTLTLNGSKKSQDYNLSGIPNILTFTAKHGTKNTSSWGSSTYSALIVEQYAYINNLWDWQEVYNQVVGTSDTQSGNITLHETATKLRFRTLETGTDHTISNIRVTRQKFMRTDIAAIDEHIEAKSIWQKTITISHSNIDVMTVTSKQGILNLSTSSLGTGCDDFGNDAFTVSFSTNTKYMDYLDTIVITDNKLQPTTIEIPVHLYSQGLHQVINGFELPGSCLTTDILEPFAATATSELDVTYLSSDSTIAYVDEDKQLVILAAGTVSITVLQAGDDRYEPASETKTIEIHLTPTTIIESPQANPIAAGQSLASAKLIGGLASVEGSFAWQSPETMPEAGERTYTAIFTPANEAIYASTSTEVTVHVEDGQLAQHITWNDVFPELFYQGMSFELTATVSSELLVVYTSSDENIARIEGTTLYPMAAGTVTITASQSGNEFYFAAEQVEKQVVVSPVPSTYGEYQASLCEGDSIEFAGLLYYAATVENVIVPEKNIYGGDSIVTFTIIMLPSYHIAEDTSIYTSNILIWREKEYGQFVQGDYILYNSLHSVNGCDSIYTLHLTVKEAPTTYGHDTIYICGRGETAYYDGTEYTKPSKTPLTITLSISNQFGGDSIVELSILASNRYDIRFSKTIDEGAQEEWQGIDLSVLPAGDTTLVVRYNTIHGCDSIYSLQLNVNAVPKTPTALDYTNGGDNKPIKFFRNGQMYIRNKGHIFNLQGIKLEDE